MSDHADKATLHAVPGESGLSSLHEWDLAVQGLVMTDTDAVDHLTLDEYCSENGIDRIDLLKIDAEGHDLAVLKGAQSLLRDGAISLIQFEFGGAKHRLEDIPA